ncbi:hypothetical protein LTT66_21745 [Nocardia gipuzkoensis]|uniref:hypothetical protein n=1 Tax=Nocardia gipuzkoensis TaxID=2749991 RepID=UPI001E4ADFB2|nr:hypothetical protein [Nocardia gipuzkoensis]UGT65931.1 hypothetical protein LTT66_21745 [Nocardia gipuzkoensis]
MMRRFLVATAAVGLLASGAAVPVAQAESPEGIVSVSFRGTSGRDRVSCNNIVTEFKVSPSSGTIEWDATAHDIDISFAAQDLRRAVLPGVVITPSSGILGPGESTVVKVSGSVATPAKRFWVWVIAPNSTGRGGVGVGFTCQGR